MKIAVDFREGAKPSRAGKGEYIFQLISAWLRTDQVDEVILLIERSQTITFPLSPHCRIKSFSGSGWRWQILAWLWLEFCRPVRVYFSTTSLILPAFLRSVKVVTTLADFTVWRFPDKHLPKAVWLERLCMPLALRFSNHLLAISEFTAREAQSLFHVPEAKITVTPLAVGAQFNASPLPSELATKVRSQYHLPEEFLLYLGTLEPRKNIARILEAFGQVVEEFPKTHLVLAGAKGWLVDQLLATLPAQVKLTGYVQDSDRAALYKLATGFIFPSFYEGFGLPPLEAMACGTPVITSQTASLPEVVGDAAILINPNNTTELVTAMRQLLTSADLRADLSRRGLTQAGRFSWQITLNKTLTALHRYE